MERVKFKKIKLRFRKSVYVLAVSTLIIIPQRVFAVGLGMFGELDSKQSNAITIKGSTPKYLPIMNIPVQDKRCIFGDVSTKVKNIFFKHNHPFDFNVSFACGDETDPLDLKTATYTDPLSKWFNVFMGYYELTVEQSKWQRPFGYEREKSSGILVPRVDEIIKIARADWNYFSNYMYGVPEKYITTVNGNLNHLKYNYILDETKSIITYPDGSRFAENGKRIFPDAKQLSDGKRYKDGIIAIYKGRKKIGRKYWDEFEVKSFEVVSAYQDRYNNFLNFSHLKDYAKSGRLVDLEKVPEDYWWPFKKNSEIWKRVSKLEEIASSKLKLKQPYYLRWRFPKDLVVNNSKWSPSWRMIFGYARPRKGNYQNFFPVKMGAVFYASFKAAKDVDVNHDISIEKINAYKTFILGGTYNLLKGEKAGKEFLSEQLVAVRKKISGDFKKLGFEN